MRQQQFLIQSLKLGLHKCLHTLLGIWIWILHPLQCILLISMTLSSTVRNEFVPNFGIKFLTLPGLELGMPDHEVDSLPMSRPSSLVD